MTSRLSRDMFILLTQSPVDEEILCELSDEKIRSFSLRPNKVGGEFKIWQEIQSLKTWLQGKPAEYYTSYEVNRSLTKLDLSTGSKACTNFFLTLSRLSDEDIEKIMVPLIYYKWNYTFRFALPFATLYWLMNSCAYCYINHYLDNFALAYTTLILISLFFLYEMKCAYTFGFRSHFRDIWNSLDVVILVFVFAIILLCMHAKDHHTKAMIYLRLSSVSMMYIRGITWLRAFAPTRYLVRMVFQVFIDFMPFGIIFIAVVIWWVAIWRLTPFLEDPIPGSRSEPWGFHETLYSPVMLIFGNGPTGEILSTAETVGGSIRFSELRFVINGFGNIILSFCMLNFLIAVISGTYERIDEKKDLYDAKELLDMIIEFNGFLEGLLTFAVKPNQGFSLLFIRRLMQMKASKNLTKRSKKLMSKFQKF